MQKVMEREVTIMLCHDLRNVARRPIFPPSLAYYMVEHGRGMKKVYNVASKFYISRMYYLKVRFFTVDIVHHRRILQIFRPYITIFQTATVLIL